MIAKLLLFIPIIFFSSRYFPGIQIAKLQIAAGFALAIIAVDIIITPLIMLISFPLIFLTLGLFAFVVRTLLIYGTSTFFEGIYVREPKDGLVYCFFLALLSVLLNYITGLK